MVVPPTLATSDDEEEQVNCQVLGSLKKSNNVNRLLQLFDPGNDSAGKKIKPRKKRVTVDEDSLYRKKLAEQREALLRREAEAKKAAENKNELLLKKEQLKKRKVSKTSSSEEKMETVRLRHVERKSSSNKLDRSSRRTSETSSIFSNESDEKMEVETPPPPPIILITEQDSPTHEIIKPVETEELSHSVSSGPDYGIEECSTDCFSSDESEASPVDDGKLERLQGELESLQQLVSGLKDRQSRTRKMLNSYRNRDYNFTGVYDRARRLRRAKEDALWQMTQGSASMGMSFQPSSLNLMGTEKSFFDELNEAEDFCWEEITFGESTDL